MMGAYIGQNNSTELLILVGFGVSTTLLRFAGFPLAPLLIGCILGLLLENNFAQAMQLNDGMRFVWEHPMTLGLLVFALILVVPPSFRSRRARLKEQSKASKAADGD